MGDWDFDDLRVGEVYAEISVREFGVMRFILFEELAPVGVANFIEAAENDYYRNKTIHRVLDDIFIQGGAFNFDGSDLGVQDTDKFEREPHANARNFFGALAYAVDEHTGFNYRQFYIVTASEPVDVSAQIERLRERIALLKDIDVPTEAEAAELARLQVSYTRLGKTPDEVAERYAESGGYFPLDFGVTVFGQIISGEDVLRQIAAVEVVAGNPADDNNPALALTRGERGRPSRPRTDIFIENITIIRVAEPEPEEEETQGNRRR
jgi:peptidyl-prolyl cis-trans isomerase B (cyclophilin B)